MDEITYNDDTSYVELCNIHNDEYVGICACERLYCKKCKHVCDKSHTICTIGYWKTQTLIEMQKFEDKLNNKIRVLNCITELVSNHREITKQIEDIIDTTYVNISHINDFNKIINDDDNLPISHIIKRKNTILNNNPIISIDNIDKLDKHLIEFIDIIIKNNGDIHANNESALIWASMYGHISVVEYLIKNGADIHVKNDYALQLASENGHLDVVKYLIYNGADINAHYNYALRYASANGKTAVVEFLLEHGANVHAYSDQSLIWASNNGHLDVVKCLLLYGADIGNAIKWASYGGHVDVVEYLTKYN